MNTLCLTEWKNDNFDKNWERGGKLTETMKAHHLIMCRLEEKKEPGINWA